MNWEEALAGWTGRLAEFRIEDQAGHDPSAPPRLVTLHRIECADDGAELRFYLNETQYLAVPLGGDAQTELDGKRFRSAVPSAQLVYQVNLI